MQKPIAMVISYQYPRNKNETIDIIEIQVKALVSRLATFLLQINIHLSLKYQPNINDS